MAMTERDPKEYSKRAAVGERRCDGAFFYGFQSLTSREPVWQVDRHACAALTAQDFYESDEWHIMCNLSGTAVDFESPVSMFCETGGFLFF